MKSRDSGGDGQGNRMEEELARHLPINGARVGKDPKASDMHDTPSIREEKPVRNWKH